MNPIHEAALQYARKGLSIIPVSKEKRPIIAWAEFQQRRATEEEINGWFAQWPDMNIGMVTGAISGMSVIDVESGGDASQFPKSVSQKTGGGGVHLFYRHRDGIKNTARIRELTDTRGDGGYVIIAPSVTSKGSYEWIDRACPLAEFPDDLLAEMAPRPAADRSKEWAEVMDGVASGNRNETAAAVCGKLMRGQHRGDWEAIVWPALEAWNAKNSPPLSGKELRSVYESVGKRAVNDPPPFDGRRRGFLPPESQAPRVSEGEKIESVPWNEALDMGIVEIAVTRSEDCVSFGYDFLDDRLTGLFPGEMAVIGGSTGTGKSTLALKMLTKAAAQGKRCFVFALEDRLPDYAMKSLFYRMNANARKNGTRQYSWNMFRRNAYGDAQFRVDLSMAEKDAAVDNLFFAKVNERITFKALSEKIRREKESGCELFLLDHLHMLDLDQSGQNRAINIENFLNDLKLLIIELGVRLVLVVQYGKLGGDIPNRESFKDAAAISHIANYVIHLWREREVKAAKNQQSELLKFQDKAASSLVETWFIMDKVRNPNGEQACAVNFDRETGDYQNGPAREPRPITDMLPPRPKAPEGPGVPMFPT